MTDDEYPDALGHILKAALTSPPGSLTYEPAGDRYADCPACGTPWEDCEASQSYADEEDPACCDGCEHEWISPPPAYTVSRVWPLDEPAKLTAPHPQGGPWSAVEALRGPFFPWRRKP